MNSALFAHGTGVLEIQSTNDGYSAFLEKQAYFMTEMEYVCKSTSDATVKAALRD